MALFFFETYKCTTSPKSWAGPDIVSFLQMFDRSRGRRVAQWFIDLKPFPGISKARHWPPWRSNICSNAQWYFFRTTSLEVEYLTQMFPLCWVFGKMDKKSRILGSTKIRDDASYWVLSPATARSAFQYPWRSKKPPIAWLAYNRLAPKPYRHPGPWNVRAPNRQGQI